jgi:hypothetical protein
LFFSRYVTASLVIRLKKSITSIGVNLKKEFEIQHFILMRFCNLFV